MSKYNWNATNIIHKYNGKKQVGCPGDDKFTRSEALFSCRNFYHHNCNLTSSLEGWGGDRYLVIYFLFSVSQSYPVSMDLLTEKIDFFHEV